MKILIACEESQRVCIEMRKLGHEAYSCDIEPCSGGHPEWHIQQEVIPLLNSRCEFDTCDGNHHVIDSRWDMIIAHPPCTYLSNAGNKYRNVPGRKELTLKAADFFMEFINADCDRIAVENPPGYMNSHYRPADQTVHPYFFVDKVDNPDYKLKRTCLWLKNLVPLQRSNNFVQPNPIRITIRSDGTIKNRYTTETLHSKKDRSKTAVSFARAMAEQWAGEADDL